MKNIFQEIFSFLSGAIMLGVLVIVAILIYNTAPYSLYFVAIALVYLAISFLFKSQISKMIKATEKNGKIKLYLLYFFRNSLQILVLALIPIVIFQVILEKHWSLGLNPYMERIENLYVKIAQLSTDFHAVGIFMFLMLIVLILGPFFFYRSSKGRYLFVNLTKTLFVLNLVFFIATFSFYTSTFSIEKEQAWRFDKRDSMKFTEKYLRKNLQEYYILSQIGISSSLQTEMVRIISTVITVAVTHDLAVKLHDETYREVKEKILKQELSGNLFSKSWRKIISNEDKLKLEIVKLLDRDLEIYKVSDIEKLFSANYNSKEVFDRLKILKEKEIEVSSLSKAKFESLTQTISISVGALLPDVSDQIIKHIVDDVLDKAIEFKIKFFLKDKKMKIPTLLLATQLTLFEPHDSIVNNGEFISVYEKNLKLINKNYLDIAYPQIYEDYFTEKKSFLKYDFHISGLSERIKDTIYNPNISYWDRIKDNLKNLKFSR